MGGLRRRGAPPSRRGAWVATACGRPSPEGPVFGGRRGEVPGGDIGRGVGRAQGRVPSMRNAWLSCACWASTPSVRMVGGRSSRWLSLSATMSWAWPGVAGVFCKTVSWDAAQSAWCTSTLLWWKLARVKQNGCSVCRPRTRGPSWSHFRGSG